MTMFLAIVAGACFSAALACQGSSWLAFLCVAFGAVVLMRGF